MHGIKKAFSDSNLFILKGEFENAKSVFSSLLDYSPDDISYRIGYFTSYYWDNRIEIIHSTKEGKTRAVKLMNMLGQFKDEFFKRNYIKNESYFFLKECILSEVVYQVKVAQQLNEIFKNEFELLKNIIYELIKIKKYNSILEFLEIVKTTIQEESVFQILKAEALSQQNQKQKANQIFQECFFKANLNFSLDHIQSSPIGNFINQMKQVTKDENLLKELVAFMCVQEKIFSFTMNFKNQEIEIFKKEIERLIKSKKIQFQKNKKKIELDCKLFRLSYILLNQANLHIDFKNHIKAYYDTSKNNILYFLNS